MKLESMWQWQHYGSTGPELCLSFIINFAASESTKCLVYLLCFTLEVKANCASSYSFCVYTGHYYLGVAVFLFTSYFG